VLNEVKAVTIVTHAIEILFRWCCSVRLHSYCLTIFSCSLLAYLILRGLLRFLLFLEVTDLLNLMSYKGGSVAEWLACWTQAQKGPGSNRNRNAVG